jgi:hypothetical protein
VRTARAVAGVQIIGVVEADKRKSKINWKEFIAS